MPIETAVGALIAACDASDLETISVSWLIGNTATQFQESSMGFEQNSSDKADSQDKKNAKTFFGLELEAQRDMLMFLVEEHLSRHILEHIADIGRFDDGPGAGIAFQIDVEDIVGVNLQIRKLKEAVEDRL